MKTRKLFEIFEAIETDAVEAMHWLFDVHFEEDYLRVANQTIRKNMNLFRKFTPGMVKQRKERSSKNPYATWISVVCSQFCGQIRFRLVTQPNIQIKARRNGFPLTRRNTGMSAL